MRIDDTVVLSAFSSPEQGPGNTVSNAEIVRVVQGTGDLYNATHFLFKKDTVLCGSRPLCAPLPGGWCRQLVALQRNAPGWSGTASTRCSYTGWERLQKVAIPAGACRVGREKHVQQSIGFKSCNLKMSKRVSADGASLLRACFGPWECQIGRLEIENYRPLAPAFGQRHPELGPTGLETSDKWCSHAHHPDQLYQLDQLVHPRSQPKWWWQMIRGIKGISFSLRTLGKFLIK